TSEQVPTAVASGVIVDTDYSIMAAGGFIIQLMPDASEEVITALENKINNFPSISSLIRDGKSPEVILELLFEDAKLRILERSEEHTSELQSRFDLVCRLLLEKKKKKLKQ